MFIIRLIQFLQGYIRFSAVNGFFERFLNAAARENIKVWNTAKKDGVCYSFCKIKDYRKIAHMCRRFDIKTRVTARYGLPFFIHRYRKRLGIAAGIMIFIVFIAVMQSFIWTIEVTGNEKIPGEVLISTMDDLGLKIGSFKPGVKFYEIEYEMMILFDNISWLSINQKGSHVVLELKEGKKAPEIIKEQDPCNIVAKKDGLVKYIEATAGKPIVETGMYIAQGDLLISGIEEDMYGKTSLKHAQGQVIAQTETVKRFTQPYTVKEQEYTGEIKKRRVFEMFEFKLPLFISTKIKGDYDSDIKSSDLSLFGISLPFTIHTNEYKFYNMVEKKMTLEETRDRLEKEIRKYEQEELADARILDRQRIETDAKGALSVEIVYICEEDIALSRIIEIEKQQ